MKRTMRVVLGVAVLVAAGLPQAWAEHEKKPAAPPKPPAGAPNRGLKPPPGKPTGQPRAGSGSMVKLDGGTFTMGSSEGSDGEKPPHRVPVSSFRMDVTEVTVAAYKLCVDAGSCSKPDDASVCNWGKSDRDTHPINCVNWDQATEFCKWANKRLPTEEEWEFAARGSEGRLYPWGDAAPGNQLCWDGEGNDLGKGKRKGSCAVGSYPAGDTSTGLKDMAGNLWEWTASQYCPYSKSGYNVTKCDSTRVLRGGSSGADDASGVRGANRSSDSPWFRLYNFGFRCARTDLSYQLPGLFKFDRAEGAPRTASRLACWLARRSSGPPAGCLRLAEKCLDSPSGLPQTLAMSSPAALLTRRRLLVGAGACGLGWAAGRRLPWVAAGSMRHEAYVWQRSWGEGVAGAVAGAGADFSGLVALGAEVDWAAGGPRVHRVSFDAEALRRAGTAVGLAVRVHALRGDPGEGEAGVVRAAITAARGRAEAAGLRVDEVQIDFDCAAARLDAYRRWLAGLRPAAGGARLTFTALPSWLHRPSFVGLVTAADGYVLQVHGLERAAADVTLFDRSLARRAIDRAGALGASFRVALPTYTYRVALDEQRRLAGIAAEGAAPWDDSFDVKRISAPAPEVSALVRSLAEGRPAAMAGLLWYRLPVPGDALNWTMSTLRAVQRGEPVRGEVRAEARQEAGAWSIALRNVGDADATFRGEVRVGWGQGRRLASDALGGFEERSREATGLRWRARGALSLAPGERREVGWVSVSGQAEVTANVDEEAAG